VQRRSRRLCWVIVLVFIGLAVLSGAWTWWWKPRRAAAQRLLTQVTLTTLVSACTNYARIYGEWPSSLPGLSSNRNGVVFVEPGCAVDAWGRPIQYEAPTSAAGQVILRSLGSDGCEGGRGTAADIEVRFDRDGLRSR